MMPQGIWRRERVILLLGRGRHGSVILTVTFDKKRAQCGEVEASGTDTEDYGLLHLLALNFKPENFGTRITYDIIHLEIAALDTLWCTGAHLRCV